MVCLWVWSSIRLEAESLRHCTAKYCTLEPAPRSTIAAAFSPDGNTLASTQYVLLFCWKLFVELASPLSCCVYCSLWCSSAISWPGCSYSLGAHMCLELEAIFCVYYTPSIIFWQLVWGTGYLFTDHDIGSLFPRWYWVYGELFHELTEDFSFPYNCYVGLEFTKWRT
jgi:hypothetical protein